MSVSRLEGADCIGRERTAARVSERIAAVRKRKGQAGAQLEGLLWAHTKHLRAAVKRGYHKGPLLPSTDWESHTHAHTPGREKVEPVLALKCAPCTFITFDVRPISMNMKTGLVELKTYDIGEEMCVRFACSLGSGGCTSALFSNREPVATRAQCHGSICSEGRKPSHVTLACFGGLPHIRNSY